MTKAEGIYFCCYSVYMLTSVGWVMPHMWLICQFFPSVHPSIHSFISTFCNFIEIFLFRTYSYVLNASFLANFLRICCFSFFWVLLANYLVMSLLWSNQFGCYFVDCSKSSKHVCWLSRKQFQIISFDFKIIIPSKLSSLNCFWEVHVPTVLWQFTAFNTFC